MQLYLPLWRAGLPISARHAPSMASAWSGSPDAIVGLICPVCGPFSCDWNWSLFSPQMGLIVAMFGGAFIILIKVFNPTAINSCKVNRCSSGHKLCCCGFLFFLSYLNVYWVSVIEELGYLLTMYWLWFGCVLVVFWVHWLCIDWILGFCNESFRLEL